MKKKKSLITKSITRLILLGVVILASISVVTGLQFYSIMESEYKESGNSFIQVLSSEIDANYVKEVTAAENNILTFHGVLSIHIFRKMLLMIRSILAYALLFLIQGIQRKHFVYGQSLYLMI